MIALGIGYFVAGMTRGRDTSTGTGWPDRSRIMRLKEKYNMSIRQLGNATNVPTEDLDGWGTPKTTGEPKCHLKGISLIENDDGSEATWEIIETTRKAYLCYDLKER